MFRILRYTSRGIRFFKRISVGIRLVKSSLKALILQHHKYFIYCLIIASTQLVRIYLTGYIDPRIARSTLIIGFLSGEDFFDVLIDNLSFPLHIKSIELIIIKTMFYFFEFIITLVTSIALIYYTAAQLSKNQISIKQSFLKGIKKFNIILWWALINMIIFLITASLGLIGDVLQFIWQLATVLSLQIIVFEKKNALGVLKHSLIYLKNMFGVIIGIDLLIDGFILLVSIFFYYLYTKQALYLFNFLGTISQINIVMLAIVFYCIAVLLVVEIITFTTLYTLFHKHTADLDKKNI
jgi:hypothetical protein